jgi:zinc/manganese transport system substrate-binding protein
VRDVKRAGFGAVAVAGGLLLATACGSSEGSNGSGASSGDCPVAPIDVVVTVNQWGDIVGQLGGDCVEVTTIINGGDVDPHEFEPSPADTVAFQEADLVVMNGLDYDHWAEDAVASLSSEPPVVDAGEVVGLEEGDNPHIWYGPQYVEQVSAAVTAELEQLLPDAGSYLDQQAEAWSTDWKTVTDEIEALKASADGVPYGATESVFAYMADALGMVDETPAGYQQAAANESDPSPGDINAFEEALRGGTMRVLVYNVQTEGSVPEQLRGVAEGADVPVVEVTESVPAGEPTFVAWQRAQLEALAGALGG